MTDDDNKLIAMIEQRAQTHGDFRNVSRVSQMLCDVLANEGVNWNKMPPYAKEGLEMIMHKAARTVSGSWAYLDHWQDIAGYATRVETIIQEEAGHRTPIADSGDDQ